MFVPKDIGVTVQSGPVQRTEPVRKWMEESRRGSVGSVDGVLELGEEGTCLEVVRRDLEQNWNTRENTGEREGRFQKLVTNICGYVYMNWKPKVAHDSIIMSCLTNDVGGTELRRSVSAV
jgi:hypothetical protein